MDHKTFSAFTLKTDQVQGIVESIVAVMGNDDQGDDVIHPGAFLKTITERRGKIRVLDQHQTDSVMRAIGKPLEMREIGRDKLPADLLIRYPMATGGLYTKTQYLVNTPEGKGAFDRIAAGAIDEYSIGYDPLDVDYSKIRKTDGTEKTVRNLRQVRLYEYSPVLFGMNDATQTLSAKGATGASDLPLADRDRAWDASVANARVRTWADATEAPNAKYRSAFFWYDSENPDNFTSYKLQFADVIDGKLTAIPRGVFAVAAVLQGSRGGVDIPAGDKDTIKGKVSSYYSKMRKVFDDDSIVAPWDAKSRKDKKPWDVFHEGDKWNVYKIDEDGKPSGDRLGSHDSETEARAQVRALYAAEGKAIKAAQSFAASLSARLNEWALNDQRWQIDCALTDSMMSIAEDAALNMDAKETAMRESLAQYSEALIGWYNRAIESGMIEQEHEGAGGMMMRLYLQHVPEMKSGRIFAQRNLSRLEQMKDLIEALLADAATVPVEDEEDMPHEYGMKLAPVKQAAKRDKQAQAGPTTSPTDEAFKKSLEIEIETLRLLEV